jgi:hypothetical protein
MAGQRAGERTGVRVGGRDGLVQRDGGVREQPRGRRMGQRLGMHDVPGGQLDPRDGHRGCAVRRAVRGAGVSRVVRLPGGRGRRCAGTERRADRRHGGGAEEGSAGGGGAQGVLRGR